MPTTSDSTTSFIFLAVVDRVDFPGKVPCRLFQSRRMPPNANHSVAVAHQRRGCTVLRSSSDLPLR
jgi:hypothetical protein